MNEVNKKRLSKGGGKEKAPEFGTWIFVVPKALAAFAKTSNIGLLKDGFDSSLRILDLNWIVEVKIYAGI